MKSYLSILTYVMRGPLIYKYSFYSSCSVALVQQMFRSGKQHSYRATCRLCPEVVMCEMMQMWCCLWNHMWISFKLNPVYCCAPLHYLFRLSILSFLFVFTWKNKAGNISHCPIMNKSHEKTKNTDKYRSCSQSLYSSSLISVRIFSWCPKLKHGWHDMLDLMDNKFYFGSVQHTPACYHKYSPLYYVCNVY